MLISAGWDDFAWLGWAVQWCCVGMGWQVVVLSDGGCWGSRPAGLRLEGDRYLHTGGWPLGESPSWPSKLDVVLIGCSVVCIRVFWESIVVVLEGVSGVVLYWSGRRC